MGIISFPQFQFEHQLSNLAFKALKDVEPVPLTRVKVQRRKNRKDWDIIKEVSTFNLIAGNIPQLIRGKIRNMKYILFECRLWSNSAETRVLIPGGNVSRIRKKTVRCVSLRELSLKICRGRLAAVTPS